MILDAARVVEAQRRVSVIINMILSAAFFVLVFGISPHPLTFVSPDRFALDFVPQSLAIGFFSALVPTLIVASKRRKGVIAGLGPSTIGWRQIVTRAIAFAIAATVVGGAIAGALSMIGGEVGYLSALTVKMFYGASLGWLITPRAVGMALRKN